MRIKKSAYLFFCSLVAILTFSSPAMAAPEPVGIPDAGARPPGGAALPTVSPVATPTPTGSATSGSIDPALAGIKTRVDAETTAVRLLEQQALAAKVAADASTQASIAAKESLDAATAILAGWQSEGSDVAAATYREAQAVEPLGPLSTDYRDLTALAPALRDKESVRGHTAAKDVLTAQRNRDEAAATYAQAADAEKTATAAYTAAKLRYDERSAALAALRTKYASQLATLDGSNLSYESNQAKLKNLKPNASGMTAAPKALAAVAFALAQTGKPYVFGAIGPSTYDCSGLVLTAYRNAGVNTVPRIANDQYHQTTPVSADDLLPGDLLFYSNSATDWRQIYHVVMYIGDGKVVHAPQPEDVVKISTIWGTDFFGATRVVPGVQGPKPAPTPTPTPSQTPTPSATPTQAPTTPPATPSTPPPTTAPPTPSPTTTPTATPTSTAPASPPPSASPTPYPTPTPSPGKPGGQ